MPYDPTMTDKDPSAIPSLKVVTGEAQDNAEEARVLFMDEAVAEALPSGTTLLSAKKHGKSTWTMTGKLAALEPDGSESFYFLKVAYGEHGGVMLNGEFESAKEVYKLMPGLIPKPYGYGRYKAADPTTYFYLSEFVDMNVFQKPRPEELGSKLAALHRKSVSPTGKFGFHVTTCDGKMPHNVEWEERWDVFFGKLLRQVFSLDLETNGPWPEMERAFDQVVTSVIPRLLADLSVKPCLLHGDFWEPNLSIRSTTEEELIMYDVGSYYAHNEMELGQWRTEFCWYLRSEVFMDFYLKNYPPAEPAAEFDDRNRLYSLKSTFNYSAGHPGCLARQSAYNNMGYLCEKYAPIDGIDKYDAKKDPSITGTRLVPEIMETISCSPVL